MNYRNTRAIESSRGKSDRAHASSTGALLGAGGKQADPWLYGVTLALTAFGVVMVYSASAVFASEHFHRSGYFAVRQGIFATVGLIAMAIVSRIPATTLRKATYPTLIGTIGLMFVVLIIGRRVGGATRWISLGAFNLQPVELAKVTLILWLAHSLAKKGALVRAFSIGIMPHLLVLGLLVVLSLLQPDLGSAMMLGLITFAMLFAGGAKIGPIALILTSVAGVGALSVWTSSWRRARIEAFLDPFAHRQDAGYQVVESMIGFGSGGVTGVGIGDSRQKLFFLPEAHTDFIASIIGEELGFLGIAILIATYVLLIYRGLRVAYKVRDPYQTLVATGISVFLALQVLGNLGVALGVIPNKGMVLPFISYGGSSLLVNAVAVGILMSISREVQSAEVEQPVKAAAQSTHKQKPAVELGGYA